VEGFQGEQAELTERVIGVFYQVHNELGYGFFESVYRRAMVISLREADLHVAEEVPMPVVFHGQPVGVFSADLVVHAVLILELKAAEEVSRAAETQLKHYLRSCPIEVGLVLAFGERAKFRRILFTNDRKVGYSRSTSQGGQRQRRHG
jgi:GxxExxY protein